MKNETLVSITCIFSTKDFETIKDLIQIEVEICRDSLNFEIKSKNDQLRYDHFKIRSEKIKSLKESLVY